MRSQWVIPLLSAVTLLASAQQSAPLPGASPHNSAGEVAAQQTTPDEKGPAAREFREAVKLLGLSHTREALARLESAVQLAPGNVQYKNVLTTARQKLAQDDIHLGNLALAAGNRVDAIGKFEEALELDPKNAFALQQLQQSLPPTPVPMDTGIEEPDLKGVELKPKSAPLSFHLGGNSKDVITQVCLAFGITAAIDETVKNQQVRLDLDGANWPTAMKSLTQLTGTFFTPFSTHQALFAADTEANRRSLERSIERTFYFSDSISSQALSDIVNALRTVFELRSVTTDLNLNSMSVRADQETINAVSRIVAELKEQQPQVLLSVEIFQVSDSFTRSFGVTVPTQFQVFYIPTAAAASLIANSLVQQGAATLGNLSIGTRQLALAIPSTSFGVSQSDSNIRTIDSVTLRATQGEPTVFKIGERYPILTSSFSSVVSSTTFQLPLPTFTYVDVGLSLKATPSIHRDGTVGIQLELQLSALGPMSPNGDPVILNSEFNGFVSTNNGEPIVAAGNLMESTSVARSGWAGVSAIPGLGSIFTSPTKQVRDDELVIVITPHIVVAGGGAGKPDSFVYRSAR